MGDSKMFARKDFLEVEEDMASRYQNNSEELDAWFYNCYYMDPQPQCDLTFWATPEDDDIFNVQEIPHIPKKLNPNSSTTTAAAAAASSITSIKKLPVGVEKELKDLTEFINITLGLAPVPKNQSSIMPPTEKKTAKVIIKKPVVPLPVKKVVLSMQSLKMDEKKEDDHVLGNKRKMTSHCDFMDFEATEQRFHSSYDDQVREAKKQKTMEISIQVKQPVSKVRPKGKPGFLQRLKIMASHNRKHHNFQPLVY